MGRAGWVPERVDARSVPFVGDSEAFAVLDIEELMIVNALYNCQVALINELAGKVNGQRSIDERVLQFWSWTREWMRAAEVDSERRILQQDSVIKRVAPAAAEAIRARTQLRMDAIVRRADT
jgi:hypothetical protein